MKILVLGGAGFVGSSLAVSFANAGHEVIVVDNLRPPSHSHLRVPLLEAAGIRFIHGPVGILVPGCDLVLHCAANPSVSLTNPRNNVLTTIAAINQAQAMDAVLIYISSSRVYQIAPLLQMSYPLFSGKWLGTPIREGFPDWEGAFSGKRSVYGASKLAGEILFGGWRPHRNVVTGFDHKVWL